ncbi:MAG: hypothetical protein ACXWAT_11890 [Methylobacter sp.]
MSVPNISEADQFGRRRASDELGRRRATSGTSALPEALPASTSAVSWGAILAGATAAAALALVLTMLGTGLGLSAVSPWAYEGISAEAFGISSILWLTITQLFAAGLGGYIAGRLRTKWLSTPSDEVYFRDTAHGFLAWAVSALMTAALLSSMIGSIVSVGVKTAGTAAAVTAGGVTAAAGAEVAKYSNNEPTKYYIDSLFRRDVNAPVAMTPDESGVMTQTGQETPADSNAEITRIFMNSLRTGPLPPEDVRYSGQIVSQRTGLPQPEAEKRVVDTYSQMQAKLHDAEIAAKDATDKARKTSIYASLWFFVSLLIGAFCASYAATYGGRQRDMITR